MPKVNSFQQLDKSTTNSRGERIEGCGIAVLSNLLQMWYFIKDSKFALRKVPLLPDSFVGYTFFALRGAVLSKKIIC